MSDTPKWEELIRLGTVNLILGYKRNGKSGLAYFLVETIAPLYGLLPVVVNFPRDKQHLLPDHFVVKNLHDALLTENAMVVVDEGTTNIPAGSYLEDFIKGCAALSGQRRQIFLFVFHASRDVGSKIMRGIDVIMVKEPGRRQIEQGSKDADFKLLLLKAKEAITAQAGDRRVCTFVDAEKPDFQGIMSNPLPSLWSEELSVAWRGVGLPLGGEDADTLHRSGQVEDTEEETANQFVQRMMEEAEVVEGAGLVCRICGHEATVLYSDTCVDCFRSWVLGVREKRWT